MEASRLYAHLSHRAGTKQDFRTAKYVLQHFDYSFGVGSDREFPVFPAGSPESRSATLDIGKATEPRAWIDVYYPLLSTPGKRSLEVLDENNTVIWSANVEEAGDPLDEDATNALPDAPVFHGLSKDGNVTGDLVYASFCRPEDFEELEKSGVNITGKITMCRYGGQFRGLKANHCFIKYIYHVCQSYSFIGESGTRAGCSWMLDLFRHSRRWKRHR
ncbi:MAG TPA: hypothetical protein VGO47_02450 [Chlamydiales bacterium]|jgi:N-acetylated-alpha-linked acidic dipeptidase|nr:hypothetical protein [Chlamydiales bacterium]